MERFFYKLLQKRKLVYMITLIFCVISFSLRSTVKINYDMQGFLPASSLSRVGDEFLIKHYDKSTTGILMIEKYNMKEAENLVKDIEKIDGIKKVIWLGSMVDTSIPIEFVEDNVKSNFIADDNMIIKVEFDYKVGDPNLDKSISDIKSILPDNVHFGGEPIIVEYIKASNAEGQQKTVRIALISILIILSLATTSIIEPILFILAIGISILINQGTNAITGEISFLTSSVATVIQLGISMDYAIMVIHRLNEEREKEPDIHKALATTLKYTISSVSSSALTTIVGFSVLMLMTNKIGLDLGFVLAKGIIISLIATIILLPCFILSTNKIIDKTTHKVYLPKFNKIGKYIIKFRYISLIVLIPLGIGAYIAQSKLDYYYSFENFLYEDSPPIVETNKIVDTLGQVQGIDIVIPDKGEAFEKDISNKIESMENVDKVSNITKVTGGDIPEMAIPSGIKDMYIKDGYRKIQVHIKTSPDDKATFKTIDNIEKLLNEEVKEDFYLSGTSITSRDTANIAKRDNLVVNIVSILAIGFILFITFKSTTLPVMLVMVIEFSIWINLAISYMLGESIASLSTIFLSAIQLGATVDYAILFTSRYLENRKAIKSKFETINKTIKDTGISIFTSAIILCSATLGISFITNIKTTGELTGLIARGTIISMVMIFVLLSALLLVFDKLIIHTTKELKCLRGGKKYEDEEICKTDSIDYDNMYKH